MSFHKGQMGNKVTWVGYSLTDHKEKIVVEIKQAFMDERRELTTSLLKHNFIKLKELRSYTGKANHVANLLFSWRPFLDSLWAASGSNKSRGERERQGSPWL